MVKKKIEIDPGYQLKRPCKHCPFSPEKTAIRFADRSRAEEIEESAYRNGFPCHKSAVNHEDDEGESSGFTFGPGTQHCAGAAMMFIADGNECGWPGINNDEDLADRISQHVDWDAPHFKSTEDFLDANTGAKSARPRISKRLKV